MPTWGSHQSRRREAAASPVASGRLAEFLDGHRAGLGALAVAAVAVATGWTCWGLLGDRVRVASDLVLLPERIDVEGVPEWVRADVKGEALRGASLDGGLPLDDPELVRRLARAFAMHPWVREVTSVTLRHPAAARVVVRCREPVAMVAVPGGVLAVDAESVVLPSDDFTAEEAAAYPRVGGVSSSPQGAVGFPWNDPLVEEAAAIAAVVGPDWKRLGLTGCRPVDTAAGAGRTWELLDDAGRAVRFGSAPGREGPGEPSAASKLARLRSLPAAADADLTLPAGDPSAASGTP